MQQGEQLVESAKLVGIGWLGYSGSFDDTQDMELDRTFLNLNHEDRQVAQKLCSHGVCTGDERKNTQIYFVHLQIYLLVLVVCPRGVLQIHMMSLGLVVVMLMA